jgi:hypothetical protein
MGWWPCGGCGRCFFPCDCFAKNCELELTITGWQDNASTDCGGIANRTFNQVHTITGLNLTSSSPYGFSCDFSLSFDDLVLTKEVGGNCICKAQTALYTIEGTLQCGGTGPDDFVYTLLLEFNVPVYDEDEGCSPSPCTVQPKFETWVADGIELYQGPMSGNPICNTDLDATPVTWTVTPSAQTTCGLGLDGTNITVAVRFKLCDPIPPCADCCNEDVEDIPDQVQVTISGMAAGAVDPPTGFDECDDCSAFDGTYVLDRVSGQCIWAYQFDTHPCSGLPVPVDRLLTISVHANYTLQGCIWAVAITEIDVTDPTRPSYPYAVFCDDGSGAGNGGKCSEWNGTALEECDDQINYWCDDTGATATITAL